MRIQRPPVPIGFYTGAFKSLDESYTALGDDGHIVQRRVENKTFSFLEDDSDTVAFTVTVDAEMALGEPTCTRMLIEAGTQQLSDKVLSQVSPRALAADVLLFTGLATTGDGGFTPDPEGTATLLAGTPKRRTVTPARLAAVAAAYKRGDIAGVVADCHVSKSQAYRLVGQAREAKLLPKVDAS